MTWEQCMWGEEGSHPNPTRSCEVPAVVISPAGNDPRTTKPHEQDGINYLHKSAVSCQTNDIGQGN